MKTSTLRTIGQRHLMLKLSRQTNQAYASIKNDDALAARIKSDSGVDIDSLTMSEVQVFVAPLLEAVAKIIGRKSWNRV